MVVKINAIEVAEGRGPELEKRFAARAREVDNQPGFLGFELLRPIEGETRYFVVTHWESDEAFQDWVKSAAFTRGHVQARADVTGAVAHGSAVMEFEVVDLQAPLRRDVRAGGLFARLRRLPPAGLLGVLDEPREVVVRCGQLTPAGPSSARARESSKTMSMSKYGKYTWRVIVGGRGAGAGRARRDHRRALLAERGRGHPDEVVDRARVAARTPGSRRPRRRVLEQVHQRIGDVVDRHDVDQRFRPGRDALEQPARERADRPVQDVEGGVQPELDSPMTIDGRAITGSRSAASLTTCSASHFVCS